jgi:predicted ATPase with chaperone activity
VGSDEGSRGAKAPAGSLTGLSASGDVPARRSPSFNCEGATRDAEQISADVAARVAAARNIQRTRFGDNGIRTNAEAEGELLDKIATPDAAGAKLLTEAAERMKLSARGYHRVLKVARTIADLAGADTVSKTHVAEALSYRRLTHLA